MHITTYIAQGLAGIALITACAANDAQPATPPTTMGKSLDPVTVMATDTTTVAPRTGADSAKAPPITVPSVSFAGEHDNIAPRAYEKARKRFTKSYEVVQVPGGHFMHREHPTEFTTELVRVLDDHAARRR